LVIFLFKIRPLEVFCLLSPFYIFCQMCLKKLCYFAIFAIFQRLSSQTIFLLWYCENVMVFCFWFCIFTLCKKNMIPSEGFGFFWRVYFGEYDSNLFYCCPFLWVSKFIEWVQLIIDIFLMRCEHAQLLSVFNCCY